MLIDKTLKDAATAAFRDNRLLADMTTEQREQAAQGYEQMAQQMVGAQAVLVRLYNLERARFLRGQVGRIAGRAVDFAAETGYSSTGQRGK